MTIEIAEKNLRERPQFFYTPDVPWMIAEIKRLNAQVEDMKNPDNNGALNPRAPLGTSEEWSNPFGGPL